MIDLSEGCATLPSMTEERPALDADDLVRATRGRLLQRSERAIRGAAVDSRLVSPGMLFVALPGERTDGHRYLEAAVAAGAAALVVTRAPSADERAGLGDVTIVQARDGLAALGSIAAAWRTRFDPLVVGVTGSISKTSTKEAVAAVLGRRWRTLKSEGNQNNEVGLPLTVLRLERSHEAAVLEMGMYVGGEIAELARISRPRIGVVTAVQPVHLARIGSIEAIAAAKAELVESLPADGAAVLNADDPRVAAMAARTAARTVTYGFGPEADVGAESVRSAGFDGMRFVLRLPPAGRPSRRDVTIPALGRLSVQNAIAAAAVGVAAGLDGDVIGKGLAAGWSAPRRIQPLRVGDLTLIDDTYNASPGSVAAALDLLAGLPGRRVAVLGEMLELGEAAAEGHRAVGRAAAATCDLIIVVGRAAQGIADGAIAGGLEAGRIVSVADLEAAREAILARLGQGDVVLLKASRGVGMSALVDALAAELGGARG